jgi:hypothetical protein
MLVLITGFVVFGFETTNGTDGICDKGTKGGVEVVKIGVLSGGVWGPTEGDIGIGDCAGGLMLKILLLDGLAGLNTFTELEAVGLTLKIRFF